MGVKSQLFVTNFLAVCKRLALDFASQQINAQEEIRQNHGNIIFCFPQVLLPGEAFCSKIGKNCLQ